MDVKLFLQPLHYYERMEIIGDVSRSLYGIETYDILPKIKWPYKPIRDAFEKKERGYDPRFVVSGKFFKTLRKIHQNISQNKSNKLLSIVPFAILHGTDREGEGTDGVVDEIGGQFGIINAIYPRLTVLDITIGLHEVGHMIGLEHCHNYCIMNQSADYSDFRRVEQMKLCNEHGLS